MNSLTHFDEKDMIEQIVILDEIRDKSLAEAIPYLESLYAAGMKDQVVDEMMYHTLFGVLAGQDTAIIAGLRHPSPRVQLLCIRRAGEGCGDGVKEELLACLRAATDPALIGEIIRSLCHYRDPQLLDIFLAFTNHDDVTVIAWALKALAQLNNPVVCKHLLSEVQKGGQSLGIDEDCSLRLALLVDNLAQLRNAEGMAFFIANIHHKNPVFRRVILSALLHYGTEAVAPLSRCLEEGDRDERIMAANILGLLGEKKAADALIVQLDKPKELEPNLRFAIYEALGRIQSMKSVIGLTDGLADNEEMVLVAVVTSLNDLNNPGIAKVIREAIGRHDEQSQRILQAIITARAIHLFRVLYESNDQRAIIMDALAASQNGEALELFKKELALIDHPQVADDLRRLARGGLAMTARKVLAADDSKAMLFFYKGAAADLHIDLATAIDGKEALDYMKTAEGVDLVITDLNMPNLTGIELTRELRKLPKWAKLPILMATTESEISQNDLAREAGVTDFISKPFSKEAFKKKLEAMFGG